MVHPPTGRLGARRVAARRSHLQRRPAPLARGL